MSLGRVGLVGELKRTTKANMIFWISEIPNIGSVGTFKNDLAGKGNNTNDDRTNCVMPYSGKFLQMTLKLRVTNWRGTMTLQKNNIDTALTITIDPTSTTPRKITEEVPFVAGDKFRINTNTINIGTSNTITLCLVGGLDVP